MQNKVFIFHILQKSSCKNFHEMKQEKMLPQNLLFDELVFFIPYHSPTKLFACSMTSVMLAFS